MIIIHGKWTKITTTVSDLESIDSTHK